MSDVIDRIEKLSPERRALLAKRLAERAGEPKAGGLEPIAIIGMGCRFPGGATSPEALWNLLAAGVDAIREVPPERWDVQQIYDPTPLAPGKASTKWGGFLDDIESFDASFFDLTAREALRLDPQQRLLLETAWEAIEDAGLLASQLAGSPTGVFVGIHNLSSDYFLRQARDYRDLGSYTSTGGSHSIVANRLSYWLDLRGPSMAIDTACSSSLVAVHLAANSLWSRETDLAVAGGANLLLSPEVTIALSHLQMMSSDGRCKAFDSRADGFVRSEGCGVVLLKRLSDARRDGDPIHALLRGTAVNQDGRTNGMTAPNGRAQVAVIRAALQRAGIGADSIGYVETHGTGTALGDPIEVEALAEVCTPRADRRPCVLGAIKSNIGHLETAAGIAGLIKAVLCLRHEHIPPNLHLRKLNPHIRLDGTPFVLPGDGVAWRATGAPRVASVNSFGFGGTNAHAVLEEAPRDDGTVALPSEGDGGLAEPLPLLISARTGDALRSLAAAYAGALDAGSAAYSDVCYTACVRRSQHEMRLAVMGASRREAAEALRMHLRGDRSSRSWAGTAAPGDAPHVCLVFSGQGPQRAGMGGDLLKSEPAFREAIELIDARFEPLAGWSLLAELQYGDESRFKHTEVAQPAIFAVQVGLAALLQDYGVEVAAVVGHSVGEVAAAFVAGVLDLEDAVRVIYHRSRVMERTHGSGAMAVAPLTEREARALIAPFGNGLSIAAVNAPRMVTLAGDHDAIARCIQRDDRCRRLGVEYAFHSGHMDAIRGVLVGQLDGIRPQPASIPIYSTVTGTLAQPGDYGPEYWGRNIREPVAFAVALSGIARAGARCFVELSPHPVLSSAVAQCLDAEPERRTTSVVGTLRNGKSDVSALRAALAELHVNGVNIRWPRLFPHGGKVVSLPRYPWQRRRYWFEPTPAAAPSTRPAAVPPAGARTIPAPQSGHPLLGARVESPLEAIQLDGALSLESVPWLEQHRLLGIAVMPAAGFLEMMLAASRVALGGMGELEDVFVHTPLTLEPGEAKTTQVVVEPSPGGQRFRILTYAPGPGGRGDWTQHVSGRIRSREAAPSGSGVSSNLDDRLARCQQEVDVRAMYATAAAAGVELGPAFHTVERIRRGPGEAVGWIVAPERAATAGQGYLLHPTLVDGWIHVGHQALGGGRGASGGPMVPIGIGRLRVYELPARPAIVHAVSRAAGGDGDVRSQEVDLRIQDSDGRVLVELTGLRFAVGSLDGVSRSNAPAIQEAVYELQWRPKPLGPVPAMAGAAAARWLVWGEADAFTEHLVERLRSSELPVWTVTPGTTFAVGETHATVRADNPGDFRAVVGETLGKTTRPWVVVFGWGVAPSTESPGAAEIHATQAVALQGLLHLVQALDGPVLERLQRLIIVTQGAEGPEPTPGGLFQAPLWGVGRVIGIERPQLPKLQIDLETFDRTASVEQLLSEQWANDGEDQVAYRAGRRFAARLVGSRPQPRTEAGPVRGADAQLSGDAFRLALGRPGLPDTLALAPLIRGELEPGQVEIEVAAAGLNFRDVMISLGMYPGLDGSGPLGSECAGRISRIGANVEGLRPGDEVLAIAVGCFGSHAVASAALTWRKPSGLSFEQAAALPIAYLTAAFCLEYPGRIAAGDRVLIHSAAGGVGMAAVQLARRAGAEIFGTAGSPEKRALIAASGVHHVMSSRTPAFAEEILAITGGEGIDIVLNSLAGELIDKSFAVMRSGGRFVEIGVTDLRTQAQVDALQPGITYTPVMLTDICRDDPALIQELGARILAGISKGTLEPLPVRSFPLQRANEAYRHMAQARHTGKIVLTVEPQRAAAAEKVEDKPTIRSDGAYLITGGLGGLGRELARWLVDHGARHLVLVGRREPTAAALEEIDGLRGRGAEVVVATADVGRREDLRGLLEDLDRRGLALKGVIHAAGLLDDGVLRDQRWERFERVLVPKVTGAWNLHELTEATPLDFFVLFSSVAGWLGSAGQANYAAANCFLDALARWRRYHGMPANSIAWGPWADVGMFAEVGPAAQRFTAERGLEPMPVSAALAILERVLGGSAAQVAVARIDWSTYARWVGAAGQKPHLVGDLLPQAAEPVDQPQSGLLVALKAAPSEKRAGLLQQSLRAEVAGVVGCEPERLTPKQAFRNLGMDSLMSVELRNRLELLLGCTLPSTLAFDYPNLDALGHHLLVNALGYGDSGELGDVDLEEAPPEEPPPPTAPERAEDAPDDDISADEAEEQLLEQLNQLRQNRDG